MYSHFFGEKNRSLVFLTKRWITHVNLTTTILKKIVKKKTPNMRDSYEKTAKKITSSFVKIVEFFWVLK